MARFKQPILAANDMKLVSLLGCDTTYVMLGYYHSV